MRRHRAGRLDIPPVPLYLALRLYKRFENGAGPCHKAARELSNRSAALKVQ